MRISAHSISSKCGNTYIIIYKYGEFNTSIRYIISTSALTVKVALHKNPSNMVLRLVVIIAVVLQVTSAKTFTGCELAKELRKQGIPNNHELNEWMCIAQHESSFNTAAKHTNTNGSIDYGLFQINDKYWCEHGKAGKDCNVQCESLTNDNIADDLKCALHIKKVQGLKAWVAWNNECAGKTLKDYTKC
ncbi:hypothetical protein L9F63_001281 [Diploptera punctata]|uniref:lysozyme n=1 Tax=Diploptera punctata TaxID=6984 RepID=A0AAD8EIT5_DIPPU|nr:hypothetical protein L9F63_001281 [Diploptera punctata]